MADTENDERNEKELSIELLEIAECNFLLSIIGLKSDQITQLIGHDVNHIGWIFGHCVSQMNYYVELCQGNQIMSKKEITHYAYAAAKDEAKKELPTSFKELVEKYLKISGNFFSHLRGLPQEKFRQVPIVDAGKQTKESIMRIIQRIALHYMGHMGQIVLIRRSIGNPGFGFVAGMSKENREKRIAQWKKWWEENKEDFS